MEDLFAHPTRYRDSLAASFRYPQELWPGRSYVVVFPTKFCPVGCAHCYFASPKPAEAARIPNAVLGADDIAAVSKFVDDARTEFLQITGGGEPLLEFESVLRLIGDAHTERIDINTSGVTLTSVTKAREVLDTLFDAFRHSENSGSLNFRLSIDEFHLDQIKDKAIRILLSVFRQDFARYSQGRFFLKFHTLFYDKTLAALLERLQGEIRQVDEEKVYGITVPTRMHLNDGTSFEISHAARMLASAMPDMSRDEEIAKAVRWYDVIGKHRPGQYFDASGQQGLCLVIHEDGDIELWNTTPRDSLCNIRKHSFAQVRRSILTDVIQVAALEKTRMYVDSVLKEINPLASRRAKAVGSATLFNRRALSESRDSLYVAIRIVQDYLAEGRGDWFDMSSMDPLLASALVLTKEDLQALHGKSRNDIVEELTVDPRVTLEELVHLYRSLENGHYEISPERLIARVRASQTIHEAVKAKFMSAVAR